MLISSNLVFGEWDQIFKNPMTTAAAIDRVVHHSVILEFSGKSVRAEKAAERQSASVDPTSEGPTDSSDRPRRKR
jgi:DNA replication protein DnaC